MGLRDLFRGKGKTSPQSRIDKLIRKVENRYGQSIERYSAMEQLLEIGSETALIGLLRRFNIAASKSIEDEEEKSWIFRKLSELKPEIVLPAIKRFCLAHENIAWPLRIVEDIASEEQEWDILHALLAQHPPGYERDPAKKMQLLTRVAEMNSPQVPDLLAPYLNDNDEGIRFFCVEKLLEIADPKSLQPLVERLIAPQEDSLRLRNAILDGIARLNWDVSAYHEQITASLGQAYAPAAGQILQKR